MPPAEFKDWVPIINLAIAIGTLAYAWLTRAGREAISKVDALHADHAALAMRVAKVEGELETVPGKDELHELRLEMERMRGSINVLRESLKPVAAMAERMQEALLEERTK